MIGAVRRWWSNPWRRPTFLAAGYWLYVLWSIVPVLIAVQFAFNSGRSRSTWQGFSLRWWFEDPDRSLWHDPTLRDALVNSLWLAFFTMLIAVALGERPSGGFGIQVTSVKMSDGKAFVQVASSSPGGNCVVHTALTQPFDIVKVASVPDPVEFEERRVITSCSP